MALSVTQQSEILRILGYPQLGFSASLTLGYPGYASQFAQWQPYAWLQRRMVAMSTDEEVAILGAESTFFGACFAPATVAFTLSTPSTIAAGPTVSVDVAGELVSVVATDTDTPETLADTLAAAIASDATAAGNFMVSASGATITLGVRSLGVDGNGIPLQAASSNPSLLVAFGSTPAAMFSFGVTAGGTNPNGPSIMPEGSSRAVFGYVPIIRILESDLGGSRDNLDTTSAESYVPRPDEMQMRARLLGRYRRELADRLSVPLDPDLVGNRRAGRIRRI